MSSQAAFWRNVTLIGIAHIAFFIALLHWKGRSFSARTEAIMWMASTEDRSPVAAASSPLLAARSTPTAEVSASADRPNEKVAEEQPTSHIAESEIQLPTENGTVTPTPKPSPRPVAERTPAHAKPTTKPTSKASPKTKSSAAKPATPKPRASRSAATLGEKDKTTDKRETRAGTQKSGAAIGTTRPASEETSPDLNWYGNMLHDRFYREWDQPTTVVAAGAKLSALVKIRIENDGRISAFNIARSSGNVVVDESILSLAKRVTKVDPLPTALAGRDHYEVSINFELNPAE